MGGIMSMFGGAPEAPEPMIMPAAAPPPPPAANVQAQSIANLEATDDYIEAEKRRRKNASKAASTFALSDSKTSKTILGG